MSYESKRLAGNTSYWRFLPESTAKTFAEAFEEFVREIQRPEVTRLMVVMETDGLLMRLSKDDFNQLLKEPMLNDVDLDQAKAMIKQGAVLVDVRMESEHKAGSIKGSMNVPLFMLRLKAEQLDRSKRYICYCETGRRSQAAAYLMSEAGFESYTLKGGLQAISHGNPSG